MKTVLTTLWRTLECVLFTFLLFTTYSNWNEEIDWHSRLFHVELKMDK
jgi:hypothetical protein